MVHSPIAQHGWGKASRNWTLIIRLLQHLSRANPVLTRYGNLQGPRSIEGLRIQASVINVFNAKNALLTVLNSYHQYRFCLLHKIRRTAGFFFNMYLLEQYHCCQVVTIRYDDLQHWEQYSTITNRKKLVCVVILLCSLVAIDVRDQVNHHMPYWLQDVGHRAKLIEANWRIYTPLQKIGITWSTGGMPEYWYPLWNTYCPW